jgi:hypothetical protein
MEDLIGHEGLEGGDDDSYTPCHAAGAKRRQLVAERLPAASRHQYKDIVSGQRGIDGFELIAAERFELECTSQDAYDFSVIWGVSGVNGSGASMRWVDAAGYPRGWWGRMEGCGRGE